MNSLFIYIQISLKKVFLLIARPTQSDVEGLNASRTTLVETVR